MNVRILRYAIPLSVVIIGCIFAVITVFNFRYRAQETAGLMMADDIQRLVGIFQQIDRECGIIDFDYQKNRINFLNVKSFVGSEVGPMNLKHPEKWRGPYLMDNPTMQEKEYLIVRTHEGYFVTPGEGVRVPSGKVIGKDIMLSENTDIGAMMLDPKTLNYDGKALAAELLLGGSKHAMPLFDRYR